MLYYSPLFDKENPSKIIIYYLHIIIIIITSVVAVQRFSALLLFPALLGLSLSFWWAAQTRTQPVERCLCGECFCQLALWRRLKGTIGPRDGGRSRQRRWRRRWCGESRDASCHALSLLELGNHRAPGPQQRGQSERYWQDDGRWWIVGPNIEKVPPRNSERVVTSRAPAASAWNGSQTCQLGVFKGKCWSPGAARRWKLTLQKSEITGRTRSATLHAPCGTLTAAVAHFHVMDGFNLTTLIGLLDVQLLQMWPLLFNSAPYSLVEPVVAQVRPYEAAMQ